MRILATGRLFSKFGWGHPAQRSMGTFMVIEYAPVLDFCTVNPTAIWISFRLGTPALTCRWRPLPSHCPLVFPAVRSLFGSLFRTPICPAFSQPIQSNYRFSATVVRDVWAQWCSASLRPLLSADSGPRRSPDIRACRDQWPPADVTDARQIRRQRQNPCPDMIWILPLRLGLSPICDGVGVRDVGKDPARGRVGKAFVIIAPALPS